jgi:spermidine synthase
LCFIAAAREASLGQAVGRLTAVNTIAAAAGALGTSFLLLPHYGLWQSFVLFATAYWLVGAVGLRSKPMQPRRSSATPWLRAAVFVIMFLAAFSVTSWPQSVVPKSARLLYERETPYGLINVLEGSGGELQLRENNHYVLGGSVGAGSEFRQGRLPLLLHPAPLEVCFLGLATGVTASAALADPAVKRTTAVELVPEVVTAARLFGAYNAGVMDDPRVQIVANDARHYLYATPRQFDVIVSDLFVPWHSQTGYLYTVEHYRAARARLKPGGLFCQWLPLYQVGSRECAMIADSFASVFPVTTLWRGELGVDGAPLLALVGSEAPLKLDGAALQARLATLADPSWGSDKFLETPEAWMQLYVGTWPAPGSAGILPVSSNKDDGQDVHPTSLLNTDDHPRVEFLAPISNRQNVMLKGARLSEYYVDVLSRLGAGGLAYTPRPGMPALSLPANQLRQLQGE